MGTPVKFLRYLGYALLGAGLSAAALTAVAGPFGALRDLRHPLILAAIGYLLASRGAGRWVLIERLKQALSAPLFPWILALGAATFFIRIKLLEWWSGNISGVDFAHLDYAIWSTAQGRFMEIPILFSHPTFLDMFGNHYSPILYVHVLAKLLYSSPASSLIVHALSLAAAVPVLHALARRIVDRISASLLTLAYVFCGSVAATLQFEIHQESFYPLGFGLVFLGLFSHFAWAILGSLVVLAVKEDAGLYLAPLFFWAAILYPGKRWPSALMGVVSAAWVLFALKIAMPRHQPPAMEVTSYYFFLWAKYGSSYGEVALSMLKHPHWVIADIFLNPALYKNLLPWGFLPLASPLGLIALPPLAIHSTAVSYPVIRSFGLYYGIVLVPIFFTAAADGLRRIKGDKPRRLVALSLVALSALIGGAYLRFPAPRTEFAAWRAVGEQVTKALPGESTIWVQSGLLPYLPYGTQWRRIDTFSTLPPAGHGPLVFYRTLKADSIEVRWEDFETALTAKGYRKVVDDGALRIFR